MTPSAALDRLVSIGPTVATGCTAVAAVVAAVDGHLAVAALCVVATLWLVYSRHDGRSITLTGAELDELREAELELAVADDPHDAARRLAERALTLLGARTAVVLIEGIGDTVRVHAGRTEATETTEVYGSGSRMRLLDDAGLPCGSIAVSGRADGRPYTARDERILDALADRVSATLHRLSLLGEVSTERRTLAELVGASSDGIFSVGPDLRVRSWNPAMARITGVEAADAIGRHVQDSFRPVDVEGNPASGKADPGRAGATVEAVLLGIRTDGEERWLTCSYAPMSDGGYVVIARDETERKKIEDDKNGWIAQVSHELRTPLTPIKGFLHTLLRRDAQMATEDRTTLYELMLGEETRLENLVEQLLRTTQLEQGGLVLSIAELDWASRVREQVELASRHDDSHPITLDVRAGTPLVRTDAVVATSVLTNLLSNAVKYTEPGTPIEVTVGPDENAVVTRVIDHGPGVPRSDRERIFDKFTRLGDHLTRPQQGVGLGLHIAKHSVDHLGGRLWIEDTPGGGATFCFSLPVVRVSSPGSRRARR